MPPSFNSLDPLFGCTARAGSFSISTSRSSDCGHGCITSALCLSEGFVSPCILCLLAISCCGGCVFATRAPPVTRFLPLASFPTLAPTTPNTLQFLPCHSRYSVRSVLYPGVYYTQLFTLFYFLNMRFSRRKTRVAPPPIGHKNTRYPHNLRKRIDRILVPPTRDL